MTACLGIAKLVADETTVRPPLSSVPSWMNGLAMPGPDPAWLLVAPGVWMMLAMAVDLEPRTCATPCSAGMCSPSARTNKRPGCAA